MLFRPHWMLCSPTWAPESLLPGIQLLCLPTSTPSSALQPHEYTKNSNLWHLYCGGCLATLTWPAGQARPCPGPYHTLLCTPWPHWTRRTETRHATCSESGSAASGMFRPLPPHPLHPAHSCALFTSPLAPDPGSGCPAVLFAAARRPPHCGARRLVPQACSPGIRVAGTGGWAPVVPACL